MAAETVNEMDIEIVDQDDLQEFNLIPKDNVELAELKKENGNQLYKIKQYRQALPLYTEAIELCPESAGYYGNRAACYMMLGRYKDAFDDARKSIQLDDQFVKGYIRVLKCSLALGDIATAEQSINNIKQLSINAITNNDDTNNAVLQSIDNEIKSLNIIKLYTDEAQKAYEKNDYRKVVYCMDRLLEQCPACVKFKLMKAECLAYLTRYQEAQEIANDILHIDKSNADAIYVRGMCLFYEDNIDRAFSHFQHVLRLAPDHTKAMNIYKRAKLLKQKKDEGNEAFKKNKFEEAYALYTEALKIDQFNAITNAKLYFNRAIVLSKLNKLSEAIADCNEALKLDENYLKALLRRAKCYMDIQDYESAVRDYEKACKLDKSRDNKRLLQDAKLALKKSKRKDYYKILGVDKNATEDDIKKAYRKRALVHHPDRHANASEHERKEQEKKFKELGEAYGILSDPKKKARYDNGHDIEDLDGGMHADIDPNQVFQSFFGGGVPGHATEFNFSSGGFPEKKWEASYPVKNPEHINTRTKLPPLPFQASYEEDDEVNFFWLISHEYQRIWLEEQKKWETMTYQSKEQQSKFMRKAVNPRLRPRRYANAAPVEFKIKRFENIPGKIDSFRHSLKRACKEK